MLGSVLLLILKLLHMPSHSSTILSNPQAGQMKERLLKFHVHHSTESSRLPKLTLLSNLGKSWAEFNLSFKVLSWFPYIILSWLLFFLFSYFALRHLFFHPHLNADFLQASNPMPCSCVFHWPVSFMNILFQQYGQYRQFPSHYGPVSEI